MTDRIVADERSREEKIVAVVVTHRRPDELAKSLGVLVSQSRLLMRIHSPREVWLGALLGASVTLLLFLMFG